MNRPVLIVDGLNMFIRHFVVNPTISDSGNHVGGLVGFMRALKHLCERVHPSRVIVVWEGGGSPRKRAIYKGYKNGKRPQKLNRYYGDDLPDTVENKNYQIAQSISLLKSVPVDQIYINDCEADDIIAYLVRNVISERCVIASSDKDLYQLLSKKCIQWSPGQKKFINAIDVREKFGISALNFCTARSFIGDPSDGLNGVPLAGFSSMSKRFPALSENQFISVQEIIDLALEMKKNSKLKIINNICENQDIPKRNWKLMYLDTNNLSFEHIKKIKFMFENPHQNRNKFGLIKLFTKLGIRNFDIDSFYSSLSLAGK